MALIGATLASLAAHWTVSDEAAIGLALQHSDGKDSLMVLEIAQIDVKPGMEGEFEAGVAEAAAIFRRAKGCTGLTLQRSIEWPARYRLFVKWETVENHTIDFRGSPDFAQWRKLVGHCFAAPPEVEHVREVAEGF